MRAVLALVSVLATGCSLLFEVDDADDAHAPDEEVRLDAGSEASAAPAPAQAPCPPPIIRRKLGIVCD